MEPSNLLQSLALDAWFKVVMYLGLILIVIALTADVRGLTSGEALLFGVGLFLIGIGEWKNQKTDAWFKEPNVYTGPGGLMQTKIRAPDRFGVFLDVLGTLSLLGGAWLLVDRTLLSAA